MPARERSIDPILLEVLWNRLISVCDEQAAALMRTSFTPILREAGDLAAGVFDTKGNMIAQSVTGTPGHINPMATCIHHFLAAYPASSLRPGDVLVTNNPWQTSGHYHDLTIVTPIFEEGRLVAFFANTCHMADIGGRGFSADARETYEEGLHIPITRLYMAGEPNEELFKIIRGNVRAPREVLGDIHAMVASNDVGGSRLLEFMKEFDLDTIDPLAEEIISRSEKAMRAAIAQLPDGTYEHEVWCDGFDEPICLKVKVIIDGDQIVVDYDGTSPQSKWGINVVLNYTRGYTTYGVKCAVCPEVPNNEGSFRPVTIVAPPGCILNALHPAPVAARHIIGHFLPGAIFGALAKAIPERVLADGAANIWATQIRGLDRQKSPFTFVFFSMGGMGARANKDGISTIGFPSGVAGTPAEVIESLSPLMMRKREIRRDSGGPGKYRGGCGQEIILKVRSSDSYVISPMYDRTKFAAQGLHGGKAGGFGKFSLSTGEQPNAKEQRVLPPEVEIELSLPGGGGCWNAWERDPAAVFEDVVNGFISLESARENYGVVIERVLEEEGSITSAEDFKIDWEATQELRRSRKQQPELNRR